ncbi:MAG: transposase [Phycisphaeraceae bacterium]|nr:MAG: transposase [Phycisphaeraceae bacterium]
MDPIKYKTRKRHESPNHARMLNFACYRNRPFLRSDRACRWMIDAISRARQAHQFRLWAFVIMPDHVHLLIWPRGTVPPIMQAIKQSVSRRAVSWTRKHAPEYLNRLAVTGPNGKVSYRFWQRGGGYDRNLWESVHIWEAIDYIHMNPVKAGLCDGPWDWPWSSAVGFQERGAGPVDLDLETIPPRP